MNIANRNLTCVVFTALVLAACRTDLPTATLPGDPAAAKGGGSTAQYTSVDIGSLLGAQSSVAAKRSAVESRSRS